jgi:hypothetical protein
MTRPAPLNDDEAEKRNRRRSIVDDRLNRRRSLIITPNLTPNKSVKALAEAVATPPPMVSQEELSRNYEAWMKIAADNVHPFLRSPDAAENQRGE